MTARYQPSITIDGRPLTATVPTSDVVPLAGITLHWGRKDLFAKNTAAVVTVSVLDPDGSWGTRDELVGLELLIERPGRLMFRGSIGEVTLGPIEIQDGTTTRTIYQIDITATDVMADLDMAILPGPGNPRTDSYGLNQNAFYGPHWPNTTMADKHLMLLQGGAQGGVARFVSSLEEITLAKTGLPADFNRFGATYRVTTGDQFSMLKLVELYYSWVPLAWVNYDVATHSLAIGRPATTPGLTLQLDGTTIVLQPTAGRIIEASHLAVDKNPKIKSTVLNSIDAVLVQWVKFPENLQTVDGALVETPNPTQARGSLARTTNNKGDKTLSVASWLVAEAQATVMAGIIAGLVDGVNNQFEMPPVAYDFRRTDSGEPSFDELLLDTKSNPVPVYLAGSQFNHLANVGPMFQIIGGTLTWHPQPAGSRLDAGWTHELTLAPTVGIADTVTLGNLVTNPGPTIEDFDPSITLADLGHVTQGLS